jgi:hypothetical protein
MEQSDLFDNFKLNEITPIASTDDILRFLTALMIDTKYSIGYRLRASELLIKLIEPKDKKEVLDAVTEVAKQQGVSDESIKKIRTQVLGFSQ